MSSSQSAGNVNHMSSHPVDSLLEDEELYTSAAARNHSGILSGIVSTYANDVRRVMTVVEAEFCGFCSDAGGSSCCSDGVHN